MDCINLPELTREAWSSSLLQQLNGRRYPFSGTIELTERCNLSCVHCFVNQPAASRPAAAEELSFRQMQDLLDQLAAAGCLWLLLTGGEILLRSDFLDIYRYAKRKGFLLTLFTNGTLLTARIADVLAEMPPSGIEFTLYGHTCSTYESITQVPGSHARFLKAVDLALERGLPLSLKAVVLSANRHELEQMKAFATDLGVDFRYDGMLWPRLDGGRENQSWRLPVEEIVDLDMGDIERCTAWRECWDKFGGYPTQPDLLYQCGAGHHSFHVDCSGRLSMCLMARQPGYDLLQGSFQDGWERHLGDLRSARREKNTPCERCDLFVLCGQCPGWAQLVHGDDETPVDLVCRVGKLRARRLGLRSS